MTGGRHFDKCLPLKSATTAAATCRLKPIQQQTPRRAGTNERQSVNGAFFVDDAKGISFNIWVTNYQHIRAREPRTPHLFIHRNPSHGRELTMSHFHIRLVHNRPPSRKRITNREDSLGHVESRRSAALTIFHSTTAPRPLLAALPLLSFPD